MNKWGKKRAKFKIKLKIRIKLKNLSIEVRFRNIKKRINELNK